MLGGTCPFSCRFTPSKGFLQSQMEQVERETTSHLDACPTQSLREGDPCPWHGGGELAVTWVLGEEIETLPSPGFVFF